MLSPHMAAAADSEPPSRWMLLLCFLCYLCCLLVPHLFRPLPGTAIAPPPTPFTTAPAYPDLISSQPSTISSPLLIKSSPAWPPPIRLSSYPLKSVFPTTQNRLTASPAFVSSLLKTSLTTYFPLLLRPPLTPCFANLIFQLFLFFNVLGDMDLVRLKSMKESHEWSHNLLREVLIIASWQNKENALNSRTIVQYKDGQESEEAVKLMNEQVGVEARLGSD